MITPCPECGASTVAPDASGAIRCSQCGAIRPATQLVCPTCGMTVAAETDACPKCGRPVSLFAQVMARHADSRRSPLWLEQARGQAPGVRRDEEVASQKRFEVLQEIDRQRLEAEARDQLAQQRKDRMILRLGFGAGAAIILLLVALALLTMPR